jgi:hypothetical protein
VGGEWGGAVLLVAEHSPNESRFWASWPQPPHQWATCSLPACSSRCLGDTSTEQFLGWGWRVASGSPSSSSQSATTSAPKVSDAPISSTATREAREANEGRPRSPRAEKSYGIMNPVFAAIHAASSPGWGFGLRRTSFIT